MKTNLERFKCVIRPYKDAMTNLQNPGYAVVIPFANKEDSLNFVREVNLTIGGIDDDVPPDAYLGVVGEDTISNLTSEVAKNLKDIDKK